MKKVLSLIFALCGLILTTACEDEYEYIVPDTIQLVKSTTSFDEKGGTGSIEATSTVGTIKASTDADWLTISQSGNVFNLSVPAATGREARTALVTLTDGVTVVDVPVHQIGLMWGFTGDDQYILSGESTEIVIPGKVTVDYTISYGNGCDEWLNAEVTKAGLVIDIDENTTTAARDGSVTVSSSMGEKTYLIAQRDSKDACLQGTFKANYKVYTNRATSTEKSQEVTVTYNPEQSIVITGLGSITDFVLTYPYNADLGAYALQNTKSVGQATSGTTTYYVCMVNRLVYKTSYSTSTSILMNSTATAYHTMSLSYDFDAHTFAYKAGIANYSSSVYDWIGFYFYLCKTDTYSSSTRYAYTDRFDQLVLVKE